MRRGWFSFSVFDGIINLRDGGKVMKVSIIGGAPLVPDRRSSILPPRRPHNIPPWIRKDPRMILVRKPVPSNGTGLKLNLLA